MSVLNLVAEWPPGQHYPLVGGSFSHRNAISGCGDRALPIAARGVFFDLAFEALGHLFLLLATIHPLWFLAAVVAGDAEVGADVTNRAPFITFLASKPAGPATIEAPNGVAGPRVVKHVDIHDAVSARQPSQLRMRYGNISIE